MRRVMLPIVVVVAAIVGLWYLAVAPMNIKGSLMIAERAGVEVIPAGSAERRKTNVFYLMSKNPGSLGLGYTQDRPRLPAPHQGR